MYKIEEHTARLTRGQMAPPEKKKGEASSSTPAPSLEEPTDVLLMELLGQLSTSRQGGERTEDTEALQEDQEERKSTETTVVERPVWQSFVLTLQLHFPDMGAALDPAHLIGSTPAQRVVLVAEAISFLNTMIRTWYQGEVEVSTITCNDPSLHYFSPTQEVLYQSSFRPVTGLMVIVTPTVQRSLLAREQTVLERKAEWGRNSLMTNLSSAYRLLVREQVPVRKSKKKVLVREKGVETPEYSGGLLGKLVRLGSKRRPRGQARSR